MWIFEENKWYEACELSAYIKELTQERDKYKAEVDRLLKVIEDNETNVNRQSVAVTYTRYILQKGNSNDKQTVA